MPTDPSSSKDISPETISAFCNLSLLIGEFQNQLQAIRETMTLRQDFHPENLFNHLSMGQSQITRYHIMTLMDQNQRNIKQQEIRIVFSLYGYKDKLTYADFLNYIYPFDVEAVKTISTVLSKKYMKSQDPKISEQLLALFIILLEKEELKNETLPYGSRESIKKLIKQLKKSIPHKIQGLQSDYVLTFQELKNILKKQKNIVQKKSQPICRRLSTQKHSFIGLDQLQIWLRPWARLKIQDAQPSSEKQTLTQDIQGTFKLVQ